jgi:hypothetical protein
MLFNKKKKDMVDLRELQKRGVVRIPKKEIIVPTNNDGFVELKQTQGQKTDKQPQSNSNFFGFMDTPETPQADTFSTEPEGYNKREVDVKITNLDNKIYKLEQRLELIEKKLQVNQPASTGAMGW